MCFAGRLVGIGSGDTKVQTVFDHLKEMRNLKVLMPLLLLGWAVVLYAFSP